MEIIVSKTELGALYKAVDNTLSKYGDIVKTEIPESIKGQSVLSCLKTIFADDSFSAYKFNQLIETYKVEMSSEHSRWIASLGYVKFRDMTPQTREFLFALCVEYFKPVTVMSYADGF